MAIHLLIITMIVPTDLIIKNDRLILKLGPHKTMMIIGSAIDEMADDFFFAPFIRRGFPENSDSDMRFRISRE